MEGVLGRAERGMGDGLVMPPNRAGGSRRVLFPASESLVSSRPSVPPSHSPFVPSTDTSLRPSVSFSLRPVISPSTMSSLSPRDTHRRPSNPKSRRWDRTRTRILARRCAAATVLGGECGCGVSSRADFARTWLTWMFTDHARVYGFGLRCESDSDSDSDSGSGSDWDEATSLTPLGATLLAPAPAALAAPAAPAVGNWTAGEAVSDSSPRGEELWQTGRGTEIGPMLSDGRMTRADPLRRASRRSRIENTL